MQTLSFLRNNRRWLGAGLLLSASSSFGQTYFIALSSADIRATFGISHGGFGGLYMLATFASAATLVWLGKLVDSWPLQRLAALTIAGLALTAIAMAVLPTAWLLVPVLFGLRLFGQGMLSHLCFTAMGRWFNAQRGRAVAIAALGFPIGETLLPIVTVALIGSIGWRANWLVAAAVLLLAALPAAWWLLRTERTPQSPEAPTPDQAGRRQWTRAEVLRHPLFYALLPGLMAPPFILTGLFFHQVHWVTAKGWTMAFFATTYAPYGAGVIGAGIAFGWIVDRFTAKRLLPLYLLPMGAALAILSITNAPWLGWVAMLAAGISQGAAATLLGALWAELYGTRHLGAIRSVAVSAMVFSTGLAPGLMGALIDAGMTFDSQLAWAALYTFAVAGVFAVLVLDKVPGCHFPVE